MFKKLFKFGIISFFVLQAFSYSFIAGIGSYILFPSLKDADISVIEAIKGDYTQEKYIELGIIMEKRAKESGASTAKFITDKIGTVEYEETTPAIVEGYDTDYIMQEVSRINQEALNEALADMESTYLD